MSRSSSLSRVLVQSNVLHILLAHALSTEKEEIMGMLMGDWIREGATEIARVDGVSLLTRSEKRKDRVEIGPEQLTMAAIEAEEITKATGKTTRVIGWNSAFAAADGPEIHRNDCVVLQHRQRARSTTSLTHPAIALKV
ncbi:hypothetical protein BGX26_002634 [Mortierella sp. AD094]|nr:hypothetical protein BGX26_002634 [Mortierella sp. AD094]